MKKIIVFIAFLFIIGFVLRNSIKAQMNIHRPKSKKYSIISARKIPNSPAILYHNDKVKFSIIYTSMQNVYIMVKPYTKGKPTPNYTANSMKIYERTMTGASAYGDFTIKKGNAVVDTIRISFLDTRKKEIYKKDLKVNYKFYPTPRLTTNHDTDRPGSDYKKISEEGLTASKCKNYCFKDRKCQAYAFVQAKVFRGKKKHSTCYLKNRVPKKIKSKNIKSGIKIYIRLRSTK